MAPVRARGYKLISVDADFMRELSTAEVDAVLEGNGVGVLALLDGTTPYPIPMSFGFDGDRAIFSMQFGAADGSRKRSCLESSTRAGFTVYEETEPDEVWRSVVITGEIHPVPDGRELDALEAMIANAAFPPDLAVWGVSAEAADLTLYELSMEACIGREFSMESR